MERAVCWACLAEASRRSVTSPIIPYPTKRDLLTQPLDARIFHDSFFRRYTNFVMSISFSLDSRLAADTLPVGDLPLSRVLLMNDRRYPWLILVPRRTGAVEWVDLGEQDGLRLWRESMQVCACLRCLYPEGKLNVGALGNVVAQLHLHHIVRSSDDPAWPGPVWGHSAAEPYATSEAEQQVERVTRQLRESGADIG